MDGFTVREEGEEGERKQLRIRKEDTQRGDEETVKERRGEGT